MERKKPKAWILGFFSVFLLGSALHNEAHAIIAEANTTPRDYHTVGPISEAAVVPPEDKEYGRSNVRLAQVTGIIYSDEDGDGVIDQLDKCPETPKDFPTDKHGCPTVKCDINGDGKIGLEEVIYFLQIISKERSQ